MRLRAVAATFAETSKVIICWSPILNVSNPRERSISTNGGTAVAAASPYEPIFSAASRRFSISRALSASICCCKQQEVLALVPASAWVLGLDLEQASALSTPDDAASFAHV